MTVKELKEFIAELPDHCVVVSQIGNETEVVHFAHADYDEDSGDLTKAWTKQRPVTNADERFTYLSGPTVVLTGRNCRWF